MAHDRVKTFIVNMSGEFSKCRSYNAACRLLQDFKQKYANGVVSEGCTVIPADEVEEALKIAFSASRHGMRHGW